MRTRTWIISSIIFFFSLTAGFIASGTAEAEGTLLEAVKDQLKKKALQSGTLDIYDENINKVRNLRIVELHDGIKEQEKECSLLADYRDVNTGDIVQLEIDVVFVDGKAALGDIRINEITKIDESEGQEGREYADDEIQAFMMKYLERQGQFTDGQIMLFDKDNEKIRNLELKELKKEVRRMGIFYSSSAQFTDASTEEILDVDIAVENKNGKLNIQALRIRNIRKQAGQ